MKVHRVLAIVLAGAMLRACTSNSETALTHEVNGLIREGLDVGVASGRLSSSGFTCGNNDFGGTRGDVLCSRNRSYYVLSSCIQRVFLTLDDQKKIVRAIDTPRPACAGL